MGKSLRTCFGSNTIGCAESVFTKEPPKTLRVQKEQAKRSLFLSMSSVTLW
jgi:tRNA(Leu) C34 or U34 (ribose-2'-O)-methylase TrmL